MSIEQYLAENIGDEITINPLENRKMFPVMIRNQYIFYEMTILGNSCLLMEAAGEMPSIEKLQKHIRQIEKQANRQIVLLYKEITRYRRKSLIEKRIPFVVEGGQMYLPFLGLDLKKGQEHLETEVKYFTASAQIAYLYFLYHKEEVVNVTGFADKFGITKMTASRALNDLYHANLITYRVSGKTARSKEYKRISDPEYFLKGRMYIKSPVKKVVFTKAEPLNALIAGLDALAEVSMMNPPGYRVVAMSKEQFNSQGIEIIKNKDRIKDEKVAEVQLWDYDPKLFSDKQHVDKLSLYASLKEENDERIEQALEEALRGEPWYTD